MVHDDIYRAKEYIIAVCSPRSPAHSSLEEAVLNQNNNSSQDVDNTLRKQTLTPSVVEINNEEVSTQRETTTSETLSPQKLILNLATDSECAYAANDSFINTHAFGEEMVATNERNSTTKQRENPEKIALKENVHGAVEKSSDDSVSTSTDESLRDFALKLGYSKSTINTGLSKLGPSADKNALLCELLKAESSVKQLEEGSSIVSYEKPHPVPEDASCLRPIVIDGSNVAMSHGTQRVFSCRGIGLAVDWFIQRNHRNIKVFVPMWRAKSSRPESPIVNQEVLTRLEQDGILVWTPSRTVNGRTIKCYDDRFIIKHASETDGVIVSNDNFRDLMAESHEWKKVIEQRLLMFTFVDNKFMPPDDPLGRHGPTLEEFLKKGCGKLCPYERHCTYGKRCKFLHPERKFPVKSEADSLPACSEHLPPNVPYGQVTSPTRPVPPCPTDVRQHTRPLPPAPLEYHKPLPLPPQGELPAQMERMFPPTLRTGQAVGIGHRRSDPLPYRKELPPEVQLMREQFERTLSEPCFQDQACCGVPRGPMIRRGSLPHVQAYISPYSQGPQEIMMRGSMPVPRMPNENGIVNGDWMLQQDQCMYGGPGYQFQPHFPSNPPVSSQSSVYESHQPPPLPANHWPSIPPFPQQQQQPCYPPVHQPHYQYSPDQYGPRPFHPFGRTPYHGQQNSYFRSRAPPIIDGWCGDVTDTPKGGGDAPSSLEVEKLRIEAYEKLCEVFPDDVEKVLAILDKYSDETSVEKLTQHMLDDGDN